MLSRAQAEINQAFPELPIETIDFLGAGMDSEAYLVNDEWVFRFPKRQTVANALSREVSLLPKLAERLPVAIPEFAFIGRQSSTGLPFAGYRIIRGEPLTIEVFDSLAHADQERILVRLAEFLQCVHRFPVKDAIASGVKEFSTRAWVGSAWAEGSTQVLPLLTENDGATLTSLIEDFLADPRNVAGKPCLLYADFAPEHILYDTNAREISGIIDWGDLAIGDPDFDLLYLHQDYGEDFIHRLLTHYQHPEPVRLVAKLRVFDACDYLNTIADAQDEPAQQDEIRELVAGLEEILAGERAPE